MSCFDHEALDEVFALASIGTIDYLSGGFSQLACQKISETFHLCPLI